MNPIEINLEQINREAGYKKQIVLPKLGRLISEFAEETSQELKESKTLFFRPDSKEIIEIGKIKPLDGQDETYTGFLEVKPNRFITIIEKYITPGVIIKNKKTDEYEFVSRSINSELAGTLLASEILQQSLPKVQRIFTIPIPIMYKEELTFPKPGYDERFGSWMPYDAPKISNKEMSLEEAKEVFKDIFQEFCFKDQQDYYNAIAGLLTPYLRGLFTAFNVRTPVFFYLANRERAGKDYLAGITGIIYEGYNLEEPPICSGEKGATNSSDELRKKFLSALLSGRKRMHFSNNKGYIDNAVFESITTAPKYSDRILGRTENVIIDNEIDFSLSGNVGVGFTPDFANRCRFVHLFLDIEDANSREFSKPNLHYYISKNRDKIISAMYCLVRNWKDNGMKEGSINFASYPEWAKICGGIMESAGYGNPCVKDKEIVTVAGDRETQDMKSLFELMYSIFPEQEIERLSIVRTIQDNDLFMYWDLDKNRGDQTKFGNLLTKYVGRVLSDITLVDMSPNIRPSRKKYLFSKEKREVKLIQF